MPEENRRKQLRQKDWLMPGAFALVVILVVVSLTWRYQEKYLARHRLDLGALGSQVALTIGNDLNGYRQYLAFLAEVKASNRLDETTFQKNAAQFVRNHPSLKSIFWADDKFYIRWTAPLASNKQILGLKLALPEAERASREARESRLAVYTRPLAESPGYSSFQIHVPIYRGDQFLGIFAGVIGFRDLLEHATPPQLADHAHFALLNRSGVTLTELAPASNPLTTCAVELPLNPPGGGVTLRVADNHTSFVHEWLLIGLLGTVLSLGLLLTLAKLKRQMVFRERAERAAAENEARLRSIYQAVHAGVMLQDAKGKILHVNQVACDLFRMSEAEIIGRSHADPIWEMVDEHGNAVPGSEHPSMITIRSKKSLSNLVRGLFSGTPGKMVWLSVSTEPILDGKSGEIKEVLITFHDITLNKQLQDDLEYLTVHDPLTGLLNRRFLEEEVVKEIARAERYRSPLSFLIVDIDHFKKINDRYGHKMGDLALCHLAALLAEKIRESDCLARFGGEEFVLILPDTGTEQARMLAEKLRQQVENHPLQITGGSHRRLTISIGISNYPQNGTDWDELFKAADRALYRAKEEGRNRVVIAVN